MTIARDRTVEQILAEAIVRLDQMRSEPDVNDNAISNARVHLEIAQLWTVNARQQKESR